MRPLRTGLVLLLAGAAAVLLVAPVLAQALGLGSGLLLLLAGMLSSIAGAVVILAWDRAGRW